MRVFVLGAGVAKSYGGPLINELLKQAIEQFRTEPGYIRMIYAFPTECNPSQCIYPDIEKVLSRLDVWKEFNSSVQEEPKYTDFNICEVRKWILRVISDRLIPLSDNVTEESAITKFASCLIEGDVVITFNWDLGLEMALEIVLNNTKLDWEYLWHPDKRNRITLLKAHGSIDWFRTEELYKVWRRDKEILDETIGRISIVRWWNPTAIIPRGPKEIVPCIIPPTLLKSFSEDEMIIIWRNISDVLGQAERIYIFGYSLSEADQQARVILRSSIERNLSQRKAVSKDTIVIVDRDSNVKARFNELGFDYHFILSNFENLDFPDLLR